MRFNELVETLRSPGEEGPDPSIYDDLVAEYAATVEAREGAEAKIAELSSQYEAANAEVARLKAANWDLASSITPPADETPEQTPTPDTQSGIDALFGE